jgi:hypothetical protein
VAIGGPKSSQTTTKHIDGEYAALQFGLGIQQRELNGADFIGYDFADGYLTPLKPPPDRRSYTGKQSPKRLGCPKILKSHFVIS